jgi:hypothetical protein
LRQGDGAMYRFGTVFIKAARMRIEIAPDHGCGYAMVAGKKGCIL